MSHRKKRVQSKLLDEAAYFLAKCKAREKRGREKAFSEVQNGVRRSTSPVIKKRRSASDRRLSRVSSAPRAVNASVTSTKVEHSDEGNEEEAECSAEELSNVFLIAKQNLACGTVPKKVKFREAEESILRDFLKTRLRTDAGGALYIPGPPGTYTCFVWVKLPCAACLLLLIEPMN